MLPGWAALPGWATLPGAALLTSCPHSPGGKTTTPSDLKPSLGLFPEQSQHLQTHCRLVPLRMPETEDFPESRTLSVLLEDHMEFGEGPSDGILPSKPQWKKLDRAESRAFVLPGLRKYLKYKIPLQRESSSS